MSEDGCNINIRGQEIDTSEKELFDRLKCDNFDHGKFTEFFDVLMKNKDYNRLRIIMTDFTEFYSIKESNYSDFLSVLVQNNDIKADDILFKRALDDYPYSIDIFKIYLSLIENKHDEIVRYIRKLGKFSCEIWNIYREFTNKDGHQGIWEDELNTILYDWNVVFKEYQSITGVETFVPKHKDLLDEFNEFFTGFDSGVSCINLCKALNNVDLYEYCINRHPYNSSLWQLYIKNTKSKSVINRSIRFCKDSSFIWINYLNNNQSNSLDFKASIFNRFVSINEANLFLSYILNDETVKQNFRSFLNNIRQSNVYKSRYGETVLLLIEEEYCRANNLDDERYRLLKEIISKNNQQLEYWLKLIDFLKERGIHSEIKSTYIEALNTIIGDKTLLIDSWLSYSSFNNCIQETFEHLDKLNLDDEMLKRSGDSSVYETRTIFVRGIPKETSIQEISDLFSTIGRVIRISPKQGFTFVEFEDQTSVVKAIQKYNNSLFNGSSLSIQPDRSKKKITIYIKYNPKISNRNNLISFIKDKSGVSSLKYRLANKNNEEAKKSGLLDKGYGFIDVEDETSAANILKLNGVIFEDHPLIIEKARKNSQDARKLNK